MTVEKFKEKFEILRKEGNEIYSEIKPLLKRLKTLMKKCIALGDKAGNDVGITESLVGLSRGWDSDALFRLWEFECLYEDHDNTSIDTLNYVLDGLVKTRFIKISNKKSRKTKN